MADFKVFEMEGTRYVEAHLNHEMIRVEAGALSYFTGDITIHSRLFPAIGGMIKSILADETVYRPTYHGTGVITLDSSMGGFHVLDLKGESWILERGTYWASEGSVEVAYHRERMATSLLSGDGLICLQTRVSGHGKVVVATRGPVEEVVLGKGRRLAAEGKYVICRTGDVRYSVQRATKNLLGVFTSREGRVRVYEGTGRILLNPAPYWRYRMFAERTVDPEFPAKALG